MRNAVRIVVCVAVALTLTSCRSAAPMRHAHATRVLDSDELTTSQQSQVDRALDARNALFTQLLGELTGAMKQGGPAAAVPVCRDRAPAIAQAVSDDKQLAIGRTSFKLRNQRNTPPAWAQPLVQQRVAEPAYVELSDGGLGVLLPIMTGSACVKCHGPEDELAPDIAAALDANYPEDHARGFREGDLRGWFWVTVPAGDSG